MGNMELPLRIEGKNLREGGKNNSSKDQKSYKDNVKKKKRIRLSKTGVWHLHIWMRYLRTYFLLSKRKQECPGFIIKKLHVPPNSLRTPSFTYPVSSS